MGNTAATPDTKATEAETPSPQHEESENRRRFSLLKRPQITGQGVLRVVYVILCAILILMSIAMIAVTIATAITLRVITESQSGRLVAMIILAVVSAVILSISIYSLVAALRKHNKPVYTASVILGILAIIQAVVVGVSVPVTLENEIHLTKSLINSFRQAKIDPRQAKTWANIQFSLSCCGLNSAEDYRLPGLPNIYSPHVPISCCPSYDSSRSEILQDREKDVCRGRREFYEVGCTSNVLTAYRNTANVVLSLTVVFIVLIVIQALIGGILTNKDDDEEDQQVEKEQPPEPQAVVSHKSKAKLSIT